MRLKIRGIDELHGMSCNDGHPMLRRQCNRLSQIRFALALAGALYLDIETIAKVPMPLNEQLFCQRLVARR